MKTLMVVVALLWTAAAHAQQAEVLAVAGELEAQGYFEACRNGHHTACSYFVRLVIHRVNPTGDPAKPGWLKKGGGQNVDGYAEDAFALNGHPGDLHNVIDLVGGTGAPGARLQWGGPHPRRAHDTWEAPRPLTGRELAVLTPSGTPPNPPPVPPPPPSTNLTPILDELAKLRLQVDALNTRLDGLAAQQGATQEQLRVMDAQLTDRVDRAHQDVLKAVNLGERVLTCAWVGSTRAFGGSVTLRCQ